MVFFLFQVIYPLKLGHGIDPARPKRIAAHQSERAEQRADNKAVSFDGFIGILRTRGIVPAARGKKRGYAPHVKFYHLKSRFTHR